MFTVGKDVRRFWFRDPVWTNEPNQRHCTATVGGLLPKQAETQRDICMLPLRVPACDHGLLRTVSLALPVCCQCLVHMAFFTTSHDIPCKHCFVCTGIIVDNTTGIAAIYNDMLNENAPGTCQLEVNCGGRSLAADDAGNGTATNGTTAGNGTAIGHADIVNGAINGTATCGSNVLNTTQLPSQDSCAYLAVQFDASPAGEAGAQFIPIPHYLRQSLIAHHSLYAREHKCIH